MDVDFGHRLLDRAADREIGRTGVFRVDAALQAHLGRTTLPRFLNSPADFEEVEIIGPAAQIFAELTLRERAELAAEVTDVRVVDVASDNIADVIAADPVPEPVGGFTHRSEILAARRKQSDDILFP